MEELLFDTPVAVVDLDKLEKNIEQMAALCRARGIALRPHIKSHKIPEIALAQLKAGAIGITAAKLGEAEEMARAGVKDIFIANQITGPAKLKRLAALAAGIKLSVGVDSWRNARELDQIARETGLVLDVLVEIDTGLHRCGLEPGPQVIELAKKLRERPSLHLKGIFTHAGHAYGARGPAQVEEIGRDEGQVMAQLARQLKAAGTPVEVVSVGSTPTARHAAQVPGVTELRPGNYVFYDAIQLALGVAAVGNCALTVRATVISRPAPDRAVIDAGSKALNLDKGAHGASLVRGFGIVLGRPGLTIERLSEEHGILALDPAEILDVGDVVEIIPNHACTVINLFDTVLGTRKGKAAEVLRVAARGKSR